MAIIALIGACDTAKQQHGSSETVEPTDPGGAGGEGGDAALGSPGGAETSGGEGGLAGSGAPSGAAGAAGSAGDAGAGGTAPVDCEGVIRFPDAGLEEAVRNAIDMPTGDIRAEDVADLSYYTDCP